MGVMRCRCDLWGYDGIIAPVCVVDVAVMGDGGGYGGCYGGYVDLWRIIAPVCVVDVAVMGDVCYGGCYGGYGGYDGVIHQFV